MNAADPGTDLPRSAAGPQDIRLMAPTPCRALAGGRTVIRGVSRARAITLPWWAQ